ncbi:MAG: hypothetical protein J5876_06690 [Lachnospiraceae bacterium]|nr:hypothetical protein [Lachnospiraceae bacterium]
MNVDIGHSPSGSALTVLHVIGDLCDGELIAFDLIRTTLEDGCVVQFNAESGQIIDEWNCFSQ